MLRFQYLLFLMAILVLAMTLPANIAAAVTAADIGFTSSPTPCTQKPLWIGMLDDPDKTNYFELQKCFNQYWASHQVPVLEGSEVKVPFEEPFFKRDEERAKNVSKTPLTKEEAAIMPGEILRYRSFLNTNYIFVQPDGRILSKKEQMDIWKAQQNDESRKRVKLKDNNL